MSEFYSKLVKVQANLNAPKSNYNSFGKYYYRSCEDIMSALKPLLASEGLFQFITEDIELVGERHYVKATVTVTDGKDSVSNSSFAREAETKKGQDDSQITGATSSYARKYALNGMWNIDDTKDADTEAYRQQATQKATQAVKQQATGFDPAKCLQDFTKQASEITDLKRLQDAFASAYKQLNGYDQQSKAKEIYDIQKSEIELGEK